MGEFNIDKYNRIIKKTMNEVVIIYVCFYFFVPYLCVFIMNTTKTQG